MTDARQENQESVGRLEGLFQGNPRLKDAVARAVEAGAAPLAHVGLAKEQVLKAMAGRPQLEAAGVNALALEAIVRLTGRPPLVIRNRAVEIVPALLTDFPAGTDNAIRGIEPMVGSVGRVEFINHTMQWGGTGWVVGAQGASRLVLTNRHVAAFVAKRAADGHGVFARAPLTGIRYGAEVDFNEEVGALAADARAAAVSEVVYIADDFSADAAILKITLAAGATWTLPDPIPLAANEAKLDELVALIGYPAYDSRNDATAMERYFVGLYDVKRFAPGRITQAASKGLISHDCTSLGGNSGSPLISLSQKGAVGLHFSGTYGVNNTAVSVRTIKALLANPHAVSVSAKLEAEAHPESVDGVHKPADLAGRDGFDPLFLGKALATPWPALPAAIVQDLASPSDATETQPDELRYTHFGVMFSQALKLPIVTAVNIDGLASVRIKRDNDKWFFDGRIPLDKQHGQKAYADRAIDRGHMVRREDPNWGPAAARANDDTFHYTNAAPQHALLNQGKTLWQGLENYILDSARTEGFKANVFTGPVHDPDDPTLDEDGMTVPLEFWKVVAMRATGGKALHATAYLLSQGQLIRKLLEDRSRSEAVEGFVLGPYRTFQIAIADLEKATGYDFHHLREADPLAKTKAGQEALEQEAPLVVPLESPSDLIL